MTPEKARRCIVNVMCNGGFMNDWFGDTGPEFREEQANYLGMMTVMERRAWIERNEGNLLRYCRVPQSVLGLEVMP